MNVLKKERVAYCDVDDTIIIWDYEKYPHTVSDLVEIEDYNRKCLFLPHKRNIEFLQKLKLQGYGIVIWSAAGANWAETVVKALKLEDLPDMVLSKPELALDDLLDARKIIRSVIWLDPTTGEYKRNE